MNYFCIFCGEMITPEESLIPGKTKDRNGYLFQCENEICQAIYESVGPKIPDIRVRQRSISRQELNFE